MVIDITHIIMWGYINLSLIFSDICTKIHSKIKYDCRSNDRNLCNSMHNTVTTEKEEREDKGTDTK